MSEILWLLKIGFVVIIMHVKDQKSVILQSNDHKYGVRMTAPASLLSPLQLIDRSRQGLVSSEVEQVASLLSVSGKEMARLLNVSIATFHRQAKAGRSSETRLDAATSERLLLLTRLATYGVEVFQDQGKFTRWLRRPLRLLADRSPLDLMDSQTGVQLVEDILGRIDYGVFS